MKPGPPPQPTALKVARGNPGQRRLNASEPRPQPASAEAPAGLSAGALSVWEELAPELARIGLLTLVDRRLLVTACRLQALGEAYLADVEAARKPRPSPKLWAATKCLEKAMAIFLRFGVTPAERSRLETPAPLATTPRSRWESLLSG
jgi:phage terminase small subunit